VLLRNNFSHCEKQSRHLKIVVALLAQRSYNRRRPSAIVLTSRSASAVLAD
jgi:hypothetical protein